MKNILKFTIAPLLLVCVFINESYAQNVKWLVNTDGSASNYFQVAADAVGKSYLLVDFSGGTVSIGDTSFTNNSIYDNMYIAKFDANGNYIWSRENSGDEVSGREIIINTKGEIFITGYFNGNNKFGGFDLNSNSNFDQSFVAKYDTNGNCIWVKHTTGNGGANAVEVATDKNGDCFITGNFIETVNFDSFSLTTQNLSGTAFIAKYDPSGTCHWVKQLGGNSDIQGVGVAVDSKGNSYMTGYMISDTVKVGNFKLINTAYDGNNTFLIKYDTAGNCLWAVEDTGLASTSSGAIAIDQNDNIYLSGDFQTGSAIFGNIKLNGSYTDNSFLAKYDANSNCLWAKQSSGTPVTNYGLSLDKNGNCYITGNFFYGEADFGNLKLENNNLYAENIFVTKYNANGSPVWAIADTGNGGYCYSSSSDANGNLFITGDGIGGFGSFVFNGGFLAKISNPVTAVREVKSSAPQNFYLSQNYPNPFNPSTSINYNLPFNSIVKIEVFNILGEKVRDLFNGQKTAGNYKVNFNANTLSSGVYFYMLEAKSLDGKNTFRKTKKMILLK